MIFDDRYSPVLISIWEGQATLKAAMWNTELNTRASEKVIAEGRQFVSISDATKSIRPTAEMRKYWADSMSNITDEMRNGTLISYVVIASAMMRGAMTAIGWLNPEARRIRSVATLREAIAASIESLKAAGQPVPEGLSPDSYVPPFSGDSADESAG